MKTFPVRFFLKVDTAVGATSAAASAGHARCLVRALCLLLRKVSLHALLQGAGGGGATSSGGLEGGGVEVGAAEVILFFFGITKKWNRVEMFLRCTEVVCCFFNDVVISFWFFTMWMMVEIYFFGSRKQ